MGHVPSRPRVVAVLGPTNTGKTHLAMERMLGHASGIIGFPLRLLARENYDRAVRIKGARQVALITGEEKIIPPTARYFLCTVESMPLGRPVAFLGVDEIQMCADPDRGHVFTDRLLYARGEEETMFMGAATIKPLLRRLIPDVEFVSRPRLSTLSYTGARKLSRLQPRSAVVAFSAADVYSIAELVRRQRGGAAVVLGALSPRTRNAQVAMYQAGEVDYLVATDAIGMGLNMDVDHVAFAALRKFDGRAIRRLTPAELAQTAGRAGRHMNNGTFGTTADVEPLEEEIAERIENHRFDPLEFLYWRNPRLDFRSLGALRSSLSRGPSEEGLVRAREADDELAFAALALDPDVQARADNPELVRLLWDVCQVPDFRKIMSDAHGRLLKRMFLHLARAEGRLPTDWVAAQVARLDRTDGDIDALVGRIANVRTWTYVSYQAGWIADPGHWQERTRAVEDRLSDALHERLTQRFVDKRAARLVGRLKERHDLLAAVNAAGEVLVEGERVGRIDGFRFVPDAAETGAADRAIAGAAARVLRSEVAARVRTLVAEPDDALVWGENGDVRWRGTTIARLQPGTEPLRPQVVALAADLLEGADRERVRRRVAKWVENAIARDLGPLLAARAAPLTGAARGLAFQLGEALGTIPRRRAESQVRALTRIDRQSLRRLGIDIGQASIHLPALLEPRASKMRARLWAVRHGERLSDLPAVAETAVTRAAGIPVAYYEAMGFRVLGQRAVRADVLERLAARAHALTRHGPVAATPELAEAVGLASEDLAPALKTLGFGSSGDGAGFSPRRKGKARHRNDRTKGQSDAARRRASNGSPFARLKEIAFER